MPESDITTRTPANTISQKKWPQQLSWMPVVWTARSAVRRGWGWANHRCNVSFSSPVSPSTGCRVRLVAVEEAWRDQSMRLDFCHQPQFCFLGQGFFRISELTFSSGIKNSVETHPLSTHNTLICIDLFWLNTNENASVYKGFHRMLIFLWVNNY